MLYEIFAVLRQTLSIYYFILIIRILLTWFPGIDWSNGLLSALTSITDPYLNIFRGIIPPIGGFDISSLLAFLLLNVIQNLNYGLKRSKGPKHISFDQVTQWLRLHDVLKRDVSNLSGGERQRVAIGCALLSQPQI